ncbi:MAG: hypothetical protein K0U34_01330 [Alphaproteobacteria bacterium]|nr:hypothetical protein [Alphaproteobacteria bacterium]
MTRPCELITAFDDTARRFIYALGRSGAFAVPLTSSHGTVNVLRRRPTGDKSIGAFPQSIWTKFVSLGLVAASDGSGEWRLTSRGKNAVKAVATTIGRRRPEALRRAVSPATGRVRPRVNDNESPLAWLARRKGRDGKAMVSSVQFAAGERLRLDFCRASLSPKVTMDWSTALSASGGRRAGAGFGNVEMSDAVATARARVNTALSAVGPELSGILIDVCCHLKGLGVAERDSGWPQRSAKVILQFALSSLARHYGMDGNNEHVGQQPKTGPIQHWGQDGYRPQIDGDVQNSA